jgi:hypothetical protein
LHGFLPTAPIGVEISVRRWAKLRLPTGQNCNSAWKELQKPLERRRTARNVKVRRMMRSTFSYNIVNLLDTSGQCYTNC